MFKRHKKMFGVIAAIVVAAATFGAQAFTASNTMPTDTRVGNASVTITGYDVSNVTYTLDATDGDTVTGVAFDLDNEATDVQVQLVTGGTWYDCGGSTLKHVTCTVNELAADADQLSVTAAE